MIEAASATTDNKKADGKVEKDKEAAAASDGETLKQ